MKKPSRQSAKCGMDLGRFSPQQQAVIQAGEGPLCVLAARGPPRRACRPAACPWTKTGTKPSGVELHVSVQTCEDPRATARRAGGRAAQGIGVPGRPRSRFHDPGPTSSYIDTSGSE
jgi:hypothetical protein